MATAFRSSLRVLPRAFAPSSPSPSSSAFASSSRAFSLTSPLGSHIAKAPVVFPSETTFSISDDRLIVTGPLGVQAVDIQPFVRLFHQAPTPENPEGRLEVAILDETARNQRKVWGTTRTLIANAVEGVTEGFRLPLRMVGVGFRGSVEDAPVPPGVDPKDWVGKRRLNLKLGFAHPVLMLVPDGINVEFPIPTKIILTGVDKQKLGLFAAQIRAWREPEPYRGKGIFVGDEVIKRREAKKK